MITDQRARIACDRSPICLPSFVWYAGNETDHDTIEAALKDEGWIITEDNEHICPACVMEWEAERATSKAEYEHDAAEDSRLIDQANAAHINRMNRSL